MVAVGLSQARTGENLFEWDRGQAHLPEQMKNEHADLLLPGLVYFKGCLCIARFDPWVQFEQCQLITERYEMMIP